MKTFLVLVAAAGVAEAFVAPSSFAGKSLASLSVPSSTNLRMAASASADDQFAVVDAMESDVAVKGGGFWFGSAGFWGEETYRGFVDSYKPNNLINGVYPIVDRVRATKILTTTSESGLLSELEGAGLTLSVTEKLLPALEEAGLLSFVADKGDVLINLFGFLAVEPAKIAIPLVVSLVKALKGAGLLKLSADDVAPAPAASVKVAKVSKAVASRPVAARPSPPAPKPAAPKVAAAPAPKVAAPKAAAKAAPRVRVPPPAPKKAAPAPKKAAPAPKKAAPKPVAKAPSPSKGNIKNLPKAL